MEIIIGFRLQNPLILDMALSDNTFWRAQILKVKRVHALSSMSENTATFHIHYLIITST